ncbi:MAG: hypothetical protein ABI639_11545 [Thermoanaerobaculia bacterium]
MKILILGATGAAGGSLLDVARRDRRVAEIRTISRQPIEGAATRETGYLHSDLFDYTAIAAAFRGLDAAFFCVGRSVTQVGDEVEYRKLAWQAPQVAARALADGSPAAVLHYLSGQGASRTSPQMWARVKAEAEMILMERHGAVCWRPGAIDATRTAGWPFFYRGVIRAMRYVFPSRRYYVRGEDLALAILEVASENVRGRIYENPEIRALADHARKRPEPNP